tara:strand:+ start:362 stop:964 length:603 start_codon:yes stop_codon:yes gene_type:complete
MLDKVTGIILAGGKSSRMGQDKAFLAMGDKTLFEVVMDKMLKFFKEVVVVVAEPSLYEKYNQKILIKKDIIPESGPLGGLYTGLLFSSNRDNFLIACDMPFSNPDLLTYMAKNAKDSDAVVAEYNRRQHPLFAFYSKSCASAARLQISKGNLKMRDFLGQIGTKITKESEVKEFDSNGLSFININTYDEYKSCYGKFQKS